MRAVPQHDRDPALPWLSAYYFVRAGVAAGWVAAALAFGRGMPAVAATLLVAYPAWDALANLVASRPVPNARPDVRGPAVTSGDGTWSGSAAR